MVAPTRYERDYSFAGYQATAPGKPLPGPSLDNELENIEASLNSAISGLADIRRDDGALKNGIVTAEAISPGLLTGLTPAEPWVAGKLYVKDATVYTTLSFYRCTVEHLSGTFVDDLADGKWALIADFSPYIGGFVPLDGSTAMTGDLLFSASKTAILARDGVGSEAVRYSQIAFSAPEKVAKFLTRAEAVAASIPASFKHCKVSFYANVGDFGGFEAFRVTGLPTHTAWFRSNDRFTASGAVDNTTGGYWEFKDRWFLAAESFGAVTTPGVDNTTALQSAFLGLPATGGVVEMSGIMEHSGIIYIGDGVSGAVPSTRHGVTFRARTSGNPHAGENAVVPAAAQLKWTGASGTGYQLRVLGPLRGLTIQNIEFNSRNLCNYGLDIISASDVVLDSVTVTQARVRGLGLAGLIYRGATGTYGVPSVCETGCANVFMYNTEVRCGDVANSIGIELDGSAVTPYAAGDSPGNVFGLQAFNTRVVTSATHASIGLARRVCDSAVFHGYLFLQSAANAGHISVYDDYAKHPGFPYGCKIDEYDPAFNVPEAQQFIAFPNNAAADSAYSPNMVGMVMHANGGVAPRLVPNIDVDLPVKNAPDTFLVNINAAQSGTSFTSKSIGMPGRAMYRVNYYLVLRTPATSGSVFFSISFSDQLSTKTLTSAALNAGVANSLVQGSFIALLQSGTAISWATTFSSIVGGPPVYDMLVTYEKLN